MSHTQEQQPEQTEKPKRRRVLYPYGSASAERDDAITVLGALKIATATQIMRLVRPHLSDNKSIRNALLDLAKHDLVVSEDNTAGPRGRIGAPDRTGTAAQKLWRLTPAGREYADQIMVEGVDGGLARGVARGGAKHAMAVNETVIAFVRGGTLPGAAPGICGVRSFHRDPPADRVGQQGGGPRRRRAARTGRRRAGADARGRPGHPASWTWSGSTGNTVRRRQPRIRLRAAAGGHVGRPDRTRPPRPGWHRAGHTPLRGLVQALEATPEVESHPVSATPAQLATPHWQYSCPAAASSARWPGPARRAQPRSAYRHRQVRSSRAVLGNRGRARRLWVTATWQSWGWLLSARVRALLAQRGVSRAGR
ncbi:hypothetical protein SBRY_170012 [Actinacidiphila bryophytorum]|uniref:Uncharacterized protein n=1 Tax=Actinacidiphila bryophytorum TaxID=1436133 RepID=A0A9W4E5X9_9ACTN|nr:hypothetical protein SBRY_170012 [Actinacidiphila bryophytorum]